MFRNLTLAQQMFFFVLAVFLILLVFRILVKLKLAPVLGHPGRSGAGDDLPLGRPQADRAHGGAADHAGDRGAEPGGGGHGVSE